MCTCVYCGLGAAHVTTPYTIRSGGQLGSAFASGNQIEAELLVVIWLSGAEKLQLAMGSPSAVPPFALACLHRLAKSVKDKMFSLRIGMIASAWSASPKMPQSMPLLRMKTAVLQWQQASKHGLQIK